MLWKYYFVQRAKLMIQYSIDISKFGYKKFEKITALDPETFCLIGQSNSNSDQTVVSVFKVDQLIDSLHDFSSFGPLNQLRFSENFENSRYEIKDCRTFSDFEADLLLDTGVTTIRMRHNGNFLIKVWDKMHRTHKFFFRTDSTKILGILRTTSDNRETIKIDFELENGLHATPLNLEFYNRPNYFQFEFVQKETKLPNLVKGENFLKDVLNYRGQFIDLNLTF